MKLDYNHPTKKDPHSFGSQPTLAESSNSFEDDFDEICVEVPHANDDIEMSSKLPRKGYGKVYFIRHGESTANEANVYSGVTDVSLTAFGIRQAEAAGIDMKKKGIQDLDAVYTSHLVRTRKTAAVALNTAGLIPNSDPASTDFWPAHLQPICKPCLAERSFGVFTGENKVLLRRALGHQEFECMVHSSDEGPPCAETIGSIYKRCKDFHREEILPRISSGQNVLVVAHQYVLEAYALVLEGLPPSEYYSFSLPNGKALSAEDMKQYRYQTTSEWQKRIDVFGDKTVLHGTKIAAALFTVGVVIRALPSLWGQPVTHETFGPLFQFVITLCLAVSSWFVYLEIDISNSIANTPVLETQIVFAVYFLRIAVAAVTGLLLLQDVDTMRSDMMESLEWWLVLFAIPPALTTPTISLTWGGKVYLTAICSSILNISCGLVLLGLALSPVLGMDASALLPFGVIFVVALLLPALAAQGYRSWKPIDSKRYSKKWKFLGVVAFGIMGLAAGLHLTPADLFGDMLGEEALREGLSYNCIRQFEIAFAVYLVMRFTAFVAARLAVAWKTSPKNQSSSSSPDALPTPGKQYINVDVFILLTQHNIFLWIAMASGLRDHDDTRGAAVYTAFWATTFFFLLPAIEETVFVNVLAKRLLATALSRTKVKAKEAELNAVWRNLSSQFVPANEVTDFYQD